MKGALWRNTQYMYMEQTHSSKDQEENGDSLGKHITKHEIMQVEITETIKKLKRIKAGEHDEITKQMVKNLDKNGMETLK